MFKKEEKRAFWLINGEGGSHCRILRMDDSRRCKTGQNNAKPGKTADTPGDAKESKQHYTEIQTKEQVKCVFMIIMVFFSCFSVPDLTD